ncbi:tetratricopeptide repeat protein [Metaclostridioides mangenotii]|uniref:TolA-binding protein n=1 Tax=Metaclostridioides mangenotii TaxID=1540 RepID=A0ABS4ECE2_9FIRM|nr:hypothetical protein [Clostridioides mangenotii]MBP1855629.1 TolA-binding protein [Clostridioides mangenotii]
MLFTNVEYDLHNFDKNSKDTHSYKLYNESIDLIKAGDITRSYIVLRKSLYIDENNTDAMNLYGILNLIKCDFDKSFESFYKCLKIEENEIARKYIEIFLSDKFSSFIKEYNNLIKAANIEDYENAIKGFEKVAKDESYLIEPNLILYKVCREVYEIKKAQKYLDKVYTLDRGNEIFDRNDFIEKMSEVKSNEGNNSYIDNGLDTQSTSDLDSDKRNYEKEPDYRKKFMNKRYVFFIVFILLLVVLAYNSYEIKNLKKDLIKDTPSVQVNQDVGINDKNIDKEKDLDKTDKDKSSKNEDVKDNTKNKKDKSNKESTILSDQESFEKAIEFKNNKEYYKAINLYKDVLENSVNKKYVSESIYQVANLSQTLKKYSDSAKYYSMYIQKYNKEYPYYEESYYNLGLIYYEDDQLEKSKDVFREFKKKLPDSLYNNSKVQEILKK